MSSSPNAGGSGSPQSDGGAITLNRNTAVGISVGLLLSIVTGTWYGATTATEMRLGVAHLQTEVVDLKLAVRDGLRAIQADIDERTKARWSRLDMRSWAREAELLNDGWQAPPVEP